MTPDPARETAELVAQAMWRLLELERDITLAHARPLSYTVAGTRALEKEYRELSIYIFGAVRGDRT